MPEKKHRVLGLRDLGEGAFVVRLERHGFEFEAGQYVHVGPLPGMDRREYSVYSGPGDDYLEILVKDVPEGAVSPRLHGLRIGDEADVEGPFGFFRIEPGDRSGPFVFVATGTGISPFHSFTRAYPDLDYRLIHGVRNTRELYEHGDYPADRILACISREPGSGEFRGRVTDLLRNRPVDPESLVYLCGNCDMIYEAYDILGGQGIPADRIHAEVYF